MRLGVNIDHVATLRQARRGLVPDPVETALVCERAGASSIVCHLREDRRHIQDIDVRRLKEELNVPLNLEMSIAKDIVAVALAIRPNQVTLVPERRQELTTEGGLDVASLLTRLRILIRAFHARGIEVSLFVGPTEKQIVAARDSGARIVELHTGCYANANTSRRRACELDALKRAARFGRELGLLVAAGHGLDYDNVSAVVKIPEIEELNIGFSIISRALSIGLDRAVSEMVGLMRRRKSRELQIA